MKIVVFNVKFSENLGDGLLSDCMNLHLATDGIDVEVLDLAGRVRVGTSSRRGLILSLLKRLPRLARQQVVRFGLRKTLHTCRELWERKIAEADAVVIGGGNLFQDDDLNFPLKVGAVMEIVVRHQKPLAVFSVGVTERWSHSAKRLFGQLNRTKLVHFSVRDTIALQNWRKHFPSGPVPKLCPDPGLLAQHLLTMPALRIDNSVGICVTAPAILGRHATQAASSIPLMDIGAYREVIRHLTTAGFSVLLFSNGAREDQRFLREVYNECIVAGAASISSLRLALRPYTSEDLLNLIRSNSVIIAHRLHACIAAYSLQIPHLGLGWDSKVEGFFESVNRRSYFINGPNVLPPDILRLVAKAKSEGIDQQDHRTKLEEALQGLLEARSALIVDGQSQVTSLARRA